MIFPWSKLLQPNLLLQKLLEILENLISGPFPFCLLSPTPRLLPFAFPVLGLRRAREGGGPWGGGGQQLRGTEGKGLLVY